MENSAIYTQLFFSLIILCLPLESEQGPHEKRLLNKLLNDYNVLERPVANESEPLLLSFGLTLQQIIDVDEKNQMVVSNVWLNLDEKNQQIISNIWLKLEWVDVNLRWNASEFGGIQDLRIPPHKIWKPDVLMYNSADERIDSTFPTNVVVRNNGSCTYIPPGIFKSTCKIDITWFPFDDQKCEMKFGSWTYDGFQLDLRLASEEGGDLSTYITNGEWILIGLPGVRNEIFYACCPEPYVDITFTIHIRRRTLYYGFNLIVPCVLISSMALLGFTLPPDSGEKLTLGVTILLSLTVFLLQLAETMPPTSDAVSVIGAYFACIMIMVAFSVVMTVVVLNYHHRNSDTHEMPEYIKKLFLLWLPWLLRMQRPGHKVTRRDLFRSTKVCEMELKERASRSLLANDPSGGAASGGEEDLRAPSTATSSPALPPRGGERSYANVLIGGPNAMAYPCMHAEAELSAILREIKVITAKMRKDDEDSEVVSDWQFAAMVVDRICLIGFTVFTVASTVLSLGSAPHLMA